MGPTTGTDDTEGDVPEEISADDVGTIELSFRDECVVDDDAFDLPDDR